MAFHGTAQVLGNLHTTVAAHVCHTQCLHRLIIRLHNKCGPVAANQASLQPAVFKTRWFTER
jgi:hypothetical protein